MDALAPISKAAEGLLFSSESDYPLEPFSWTDPTPFSPDALYKLTTLPQATAVTKEALNTFFAPMLHVDANGSADAHARVARFRSLIRVLRQNLKDLAVYKLGSVEMPVFIVGRLPDGTIGGLRTTVVET